MRLHNHEKIKIDTHTDLHNMIQLILKDHLNNDFDLTEARKQWPAKLADMLAARTEGLWIDTEKYMTDKIAPYFNKLDMIGQNEYYRIFSFPKDRALQLPSFILSINPQLAISTMISVSLLVLGSMIVFKNFSTYAAKALGELGALLLASAGGVGGYRASAALAREHFRRDIKKYLDECERVIIEYINDNSKQLASLIVAFFRDKGIDLDQGD